jgi:Flp pilus assembly protein TadG
MDRGNRRNRKKSSCRGAEILEVALIVVPLFGMIFLLVDLSMVIFIRSTFQHAVREGVRYGITGANDTGPCQDDSIKTVVKQQALGFLNSTTNTAKIHVHFTSPVDGSQTDNAPGNIIQVSVEAYQFSPFAPYQHTGKPYIWARAYDVMEPYPGTHPCLTIAE